MLRCTCHHCVAHQTARQPCSQDIRGLGYVTAHCLHVCNMPRLFSRSTVCTIFSWPSTEALGYDQVVDQTVFMPRSYTKQFGWSYQSYLWSLQHDSADTRLCFHDHSSPRREALPCERCVLPAVEGQSTWLPPRQCQHKLLRMPDTISHHSIEITNGQTF